MRSRAPIVTGALVVCLGLLAGCGGATTTDEPTTDTRTELPTLDAAESPTEPAADDQGDAPAVPAGEITAPGTVLKYGESAIVDYHLTEFPADGGDPYLAEAGQLIRLTLLDPEPGTIADLPKGTTVSGVDESKISVVRVHWEAQLAGPSMFSLATRGFSLEFEAVGANNYWLVPDDGAIPGCEDNYRFGDAFDAGGVATSCFLVMYVTADGMPDVSFGLYLADTYDNPLIWRP